MGVLAKRVRCGWRVMRVTAVAVLTLSCGGSDAAGPAAPNSPVPGLMVLVLEGAVPDDAAILLDVGAGATTFEAGRTELEAHARANGGGFVVAVFGPLSGGAFLHVGIADLATIPTLTLREVAVVDGDLRANLGTYRVQIAEIR